MAMDGITRKQPHGDLFIAEVTYACQRKCTKRVPLGGKEQPGGENYSILEDMSIRCSCFQFDFCKQQRDPAWVPPGSKLGLR